MPLAALLLRASAPPLPMLLVREGAGRLSVDGRVGCVWWLAGACLMLELRRGGLRLVSWTPGSRHGLVERSALRFERGV